MKINIQSATVDCVFLTYHSRPERSSSSPCDHSRNRPALVSYHHLCETPFEL